MLSESTGKRSLGRFIGPEDSCSIMMVVKFVERNLETFSKECSGSSVVNEKGLTQRLCILLNQQARLGCFPFLFEKEYMEIPERGDSPSVDIGVITQSREGVCVQSRWYSNKESFFSMEAKRLDDISTARQREYLVGRKENGKYRDCGGVERFKMGIHGKGLQYCALIGYVQKYDFNYWYRTINSWIDESIADCNSSTISWDEGDKLVIIDNANQDNRAVAQFRSRNSREDGFVDLFHLWVNLAN